MSNERASTFRKFRDADDLAGNLAWSSKMARKAMGRGAEAPPDLEAGFELGDEERVLWRLLKVPRRYMDLENAGVMPAERVRSFVRGLVAADAVEVRPLEDGKPIVPIEIARLRKKLAGDETAEVTRKLKARVYRPDISTPVAAQAPAARPAAPPPVAAAPVAPPPKKPEKPEKPEKEAARPTPVSDAEDKRLLEEVERRHQAMKEQNHYAFLDVQPTAQPEGIKKAYMKLAKELHPDRLANFITDDALAKKADALFKRLQDAWSTLQHPERKAAYDAKLKANPASGAAGSGGKVRRTDEARVTTLKADHLVKTKQLPQAEAQYKAALLLDDEFVAAEVGLAWAIFLNERRDKGERFAEAKRLLTTLADKKRHADAAYKLALIARVEKHDDEMERRVQQAVRLDPGHKEAMQELRLLQRRHGGKPQGTGSDKGGGGFFSKLKR